MLLEALLSISYVCRMVICWPRCCSLNLIYYMVQPQKLLEFHWPENTGITIYIMGLQRIFAHLSVLSGISLENIAGLFGAVFVVSLLLFLWVNFPNEQCEKDINGEPLRIKKYIYIRFVVALGIGLLPAMGYLLWKLFSVI